MTYVTFIRPLLECGIQILQISIAKLDALERIQMASNKVVFGIISLFQSSLL